MRNCDVTLEKEEEGSLVVRNRPGASGLAQKGGDLSERCQCPHSLAVAVRAQEGQEQPCY